MQKNDFITVWHGVHRSGWRLKADWGPSEELSNVWSLLIPGLLSASILQINILITRVFANTVNDSAASILYLASRLMELPLGVFAIAIATVLFPELTRAQSSKDSHRFAHTFIQGMRWISVITIPSVVGLVIFRSEIVETLFKFGVFDDTSVRLTAPIVGIFALSIPAYAWISFLTRALHAQKRMKTTLWVSGITLVCNGLLCFVGMRIGGIAGLTIGNVVASWIQVACLFGVIKIPDLKSALGASPILNEFSKMAFASALMAGFCWGIQTFVGNVLEAGKLASASVVVFGIPMAVAVYFGGLILLKQSDTVTALSKLRDKLKTFS